MSGSSHPVAAVGSSVVTDSRTAVDRAAVLVASTLIAVPVVAFFLVVQGRMTSELTSEAVKG